MKRKKIFNVFLLIIFLLAAGCGFQRSNIIVPSNEDHRHLKQPILPDTDEENVELVI